MLSYPHLNIEWLLVGKGKMYKEAAPSPTLPASEPALTLSDLLFADEDVEAPIDIATAPESQIFVQLPTPGSNAQISTDIETLKEGTQLPVKQRKVSKIIVMFDDGTFQEM